jgi:hypothetical protein
MWSIYSDLVETESSSERLKMQNRTFAYLKNFIKGNSKKCKMKKNSNFKIKPKYVFLLTSILVLFKLIGWTDVSWFVIFLPSIFYVCSVLVIFVFSVFSIKRFFKNNDDQR